MEVHPNANNAIPIQKIEQKGIQEKYSQKIDRALEHEESRDTRCKSKSHHIRDELCSTALDV